MKHPMMYDRTVGFLSFDEVIGYTADDRVKLSIHSNGFAQFSGEDGGRITSGIDSETGEPKGVGIVGDTPINVTSGPLFGILIWGIEQFDILSSPRRNVAEFTGEDMYLRSKVEPDAKPAFLLEFFMLHRNLMERKREGPRGAFVRLELPYISLVDFRHDLRVIDLPDQPYFLGCIASRTQADYSAESGFVMSGPAFRHADKNDWVGITAIYPRDESLSFGESLNRP